MANFLWICNLRPLHQSLNSAQYAVVFDSPQMNSSPNNSSFDCSDPQRLEIHPFVLLKYGLLEKYRFLQIPASIQRTMFQASRVLENDHACIDAPGLRQNLGSCTPSPFPARSCGFTRLSEIDRIILRLKRHCILFSNPSLIPCMVQNNLFRSLYMLRIG